MKENNRKQFANSCCILVGDCNFGNDEYDSDELFCEVFNRRKSIDSLIATVPII